MPPKQKITKQMVLEAGYEIARKEGIEFANSRNIAKYLSCSTQPVFSCFLTMEELKEGIFDYARKKFISDGIEYVNSENESDFIDLSIHWYLKLLRDEPNLYKLLYFPNSQRQGREEDYILKYTSGAVLLSKMQARYKLDKDTCKDILFRAGALLHGLGAFVVFGGFEFCDEEIANMVKRTLSEMVCFAQKEILT